MLIKNISVCLSSILHIINLYSLYIFHIWKQNTRMDQICAGEPWESKVDRYAPNSFVAEFCFLNRGGFFLPLTESFISHDLVLGPTLQREMPLRKIKLNLIK
jgi:hypothetical protein